MRKQRHKIPPHNPSLKKTPNKYLKQSSVYVPETVKEEEAENCQTFCFSLQRADRIVLFTKAVDLQMSCMKMSAEKNDRPFSRILRYTTWFVKCCIANPAFPHCHNQDLHMMQMRALCCMCALSTSLCFAFQKKKINQWKKHHASWKMDFSHLPCGRWRLCLHQCLRRCSTMFLSFWTCSSTIQLKCLLAQCCCVPANTLPRNSWARLGAAQATDHSPPFLEVHTTTFSGG